MSEPQLFECEACGHEHSGIELAGICVGCPCEHVVEYIEAEPVCAVCGTAWPCVTVSDA